MPEPLKIYDEGSDDANKLSAEEIEASELEKQADVDMAAVIETAEALMDSAPESNEKQGC